MNIIKDKEIPRWQPLHRLPRIALAKLSPKRIIILFLIIICFIFLFYPQHVGRNVLKDAEEDDDEVLLSLRKELHSILNLRGDFSTARPAAIFLTAHDLYNATGITTLACEMAVAKKMSVLMMFVGKNATEKVPFFLRANQFDRTTCPMVWFDVRHEYSSLDKQESATEIILNDVISVLHPSVVVYLDDEEDWFMQSLERVVYLRRPAISLIQLKKAAIHNLLWIASLAPSALACILLIYRGSNGSLECTSDRHCHNDITGQHRHIIPINTISSLGRIHSIYRSKIIHHIQSKYSNHRTPPTP